jgi:hypothetical protein
MSLAGSVQRLPFVFAKPTQFFSRAGATPRMLERWEGLSSRDPVKLGIVVISMDECGRDNEMAQKVDRK